MQIILNVEESNSEKVLSLLKELGNDLISHFEIKKRENTQTNKTFSQEKAELSKVLDDVESGKATLLSHTDVWSEIERRKASL